MKVVAYDFRVEFSHIKRLAKIPFKAAVVHKNVTYIKNSPANYFLSGYNYDYKKNGREK